MESQAVPQGGGRAGARLPAPSVAPVWDRHEIQDPAKPPPPPVTAFSFVTQVADISPESIARVKDEFRAATGEACSTFDAVTAVVFRCRARALAAALPDAGEVRLGFAASTRQLLQTADGYCGKNCVYLVVVTRSSKAAWGTKSLRRRLPTTI